jgi:hypothetical protein
MMEKLATPSRDVVLWLSGYYNGKRYNTIIQPQTIKKYEEQVNSYCYKHGDIPRKTVFSHESHHDAGGVKRRAAKRNDSQRVQALLT